MKRPIDKVIAEIFTKVTDNPTLQVKEVLGGLIQDLADSSKGIIDYPDITAFEGDASLETIETTDLLTGNKINITVAEISHIYELVEYEASEDSGSGSGETSDDLILPYRIMPNDYDADTNARIWQLACCKYCEFEFADLVDGVYTYEHNLGVKYVNVQLIGENDYLLYPAIIYDSETTIKITPNDKGPFKCIIRA